MKTEKECPESVALILQKVKDRFLENIEVYETFRACYLNTIETTIHSMKDGTHYVVTGDIPAMWLRDSTASLRPYLIVAGSDKRIADILVGTCKRQFQYICIDPYANAFNREPTGACWDKNDTERNDWVWERKYETDSLCYPIQFAYLIWKNTGRTDHFDRNFVAGIQKILEVFNVEQNHEEKSEYRFIRKTRYYTDTLSRDGKGSLVKSGIGMTWSGFRPSDDACTYGYLVPANMFAVVVLKYLAEIAEKILESDEIVEKAEILRKQIYKGIETYGITFKEGFGDVYAYEVDGFGQYNLMDDANVPSLLSMEYLGYQGEDTAVAENTRRFILSEANPYFYRGKIACGIGSPHTPENYIWHIALCMQGLTSKSIKEKEDIIKLAVNTNAGTGLMHEGFSVNDASKYTRSWFAWANAMFCELVLDFCGMKIKY